MAITERHAHAIPADMTLAPRSARAQLTLVAETDGSMIPIVETRAAVGGPTDLRKTRKLQWKEAKLALVRRFDEIEPLVAVTLGDPAMVGEALNRLAHASGLAADSRVHGLGDGAPWIADQIEVQFGAQGSYLVDFYHLCDYLSAAAKVCGGESATDWMALQKERLETGCLSEVMRALQPFIEPETIPFEDAPYASAAATLITAPANSSIVRPSQPIYPSAPGRSKARIVM